MTFQWARYDLNPYESGNGMGLARTNIGDGEYVLAEDAINREAVNADRIRLLEVQLREAKAALASNKAAAVAVGELYVKLFRPSTGDVFKALRTDSAGIADLLREGWEISAIPPAPIASADE